MRVARCDVSTPVFHSVVGWWIYVALVLHATFKRDQHLIVVHVRPSLIIFSIVVRPYRVHEARNVVNEIRLTLTLDIYALPPVVSSTTDPPGRNTPAPGTRL